jgi:23S rRNA pseudouridine1911/1915/1917 synthase
VSGVRFQARPGDGDRVADLLAKLGDPAAAGEGRAFLNGRRVSAGAKVEPGDELVTYAARDGAGDDEVRVLLEAGGIVVAHKPAALPATPDRRGDRSLTGEVARLLGLVGESAVHAASRLDVGVSGVMLCAVGARAGAHVAAMRAAGSIRRTYVGLAGGSVEGEGIWDAPIGRTTCPSGRSRPTARGREPETATTRFRAVAWARAADVRKAGERTTLLRLDPSTGRMHQLRVHAAAAGAPLLGDREHGGARTVIEASGRVRALSRIALHALAVELPGERGEPLRATSPVPGELRATWAALGGDDAAWEPLDP